MAAISGLIRVMERAARKAGGRLRRDFGEVEHLQVSRKGPADFVSKADMRSERTLYDELLAARPGWGFVMEEAGVIEGDPGMPRWIVDPLDGTSNFLHGIPHFAISIAAQERRKKMILLFCNTSTVPVTLQAATVLLPKRIYTLTGWLQPTSLKAEKRRETHQFNSGKPSDCDASNDASQNICAPAGWGVAAIADFKVTGRNCGSSAGPASISGARCVLVPGRVKGCGYDGVWPARNCKGRGWVNWKMKVALTRDVRVPMARQSFAVTSGDQASWTFPYTKAPLRVARWTYGVRIDVIEGDQKQSFDISHAQEVVGPVKGRLVDGVLGITVNDGDL